MTAMATLPRHFYPVCVHDSGVRLSFQICEAHIRTCFPAVHELLNSHGVFRSSLPVPHKALASLPREYVAACVDIFRRTFPHSPDAADFEVALVAYAGCVMESDLTALVFPVLAELMWPGLLARAEMHGMTDLVAPLNAARANYTELMRLAGVVDARVSSAAPADKARISCHHSAVKKRIWRLVRVCCVSWHLPRPC